MFTQELSNGMILQSTLIILSGFIVGFIFEKIILVRLQKKAREKSSQSLVLITKSLGGFVSWIIGLFGIYYGIHLLPIEQTMLQKIDKGLTILAITTITWIAQRASSRFVSLYTSRPNTPFPSSSIFTLITQFVIISIGFLIGMQSLGISITPLITAMGVGGLAVALGLQDTLSNIFSGLTILASKQLSIGDTIDLGNEKKGVIKDISWRYTTLETASGNLLIIPNAQLAAEMVTNYSQPQLETSFSVEITLPYSVNLKKIEPLLQKIAEEIKEKEEGAVKEYTPLVRFYGFNDLGIQTKIIMKATHYSAQFTLIHETLKKIHAALEKEGVTIPTHTNL